jgi:uncharacterized membrane protein
MIFSILIMIGASAVYGAIITGSVYDLSLSKESDVVLEINTLPKQTIVSKDGDYSMAVNPGTYVLYAHTHTAYAKEKVEITDDGTYNLDIILEDVMPEYVPDDFMLESDINVSTSNPYIPQDETVLRIFGLIVGIVLVIITAISAVILVIYSKPVKIHKEINHNQDKSGSRHDVESVKSDPESTSSGLTSSGSTSLLSSQSMDEYEHKIMQMIKKEKRTTQKDLRKIVPLSEAKVSLIISDLENKGKIRKFKKGRGNIIIYVKD